MSEVVREGRHYDNTRARGTKDGNPKALYVHAKFGRGQRAADSGTDTPTSRLTHTEIDANHAASTKAK